MRRALQQCAEFFSKTRCTVFGKNPQQPAEQEVFKKLTNGGMEIPLLLIGQQTIKWFRDGEWNSALDAAPTKVAKPDSNEKPTPSHKIDEKL